MKKYINIAFLLLLAISIPLGAQSTKDNDAVIKEVSKSYVLGSDGSQEYNESRVIAINALPAMSTYGETFITYNPKFQKLVINKSYTIQKDGTKIESPANAFIEGLPSSAAKAPAYNHLREMVVVHTGLEPGATIYFDYTIISQPGYLPALDIFEVVRENAPIKEYTLSISVPEGTPLNYQTINASYRLKVITANGLKTATWKLKNILPLSKEMGTSISSGSVEAITATSYASLSDSFKAISSMEPISTANESELISEILKGLYPAPKPGGPMLVQMSYEASVMKIRDYIKENFDLISLPLKSTGFRVRNLSDIIASAYGTEMELTKLMYAMMDKMLLNPSLIATYPSREVNAAFGLSSVGPFFIATISEMNPLISLKISEKELVTMPKNYYSFISMANAEPKFTFDGTGFDIKTSTNVKANLSTTKPIGNDYYILALQDSENGISHLPITTRLGSIRKENILLPYKVNEDYTYLVALEEGLTLCSPAINKKIENKAGCVTITLKQNGNEVEVHRTIIINSQLITPALYPDFRTLIQEWGTGTYDVVLVKK